MISTGPDITPPGPRSMPRSKRPEALPPERRGDQTTAEARAYYAARAALNAIPGRHVF